MDDDGVISFPLVLCPVQLLVIVSADQKIVGGCPSVAPKKRERESKMVYR